MEGYRNKFDNKKQRKDYIKDENAIILDVSSNNSSFGNNENIQAIGCNTYTLLQLKAKQGVALNSGEKVYIGDGKRDEIQYIKKTLHFDELTPSANSELLFVLIDLINEQQDNFIKFFNTSGPISLRRHSLEIISGIGKKNLQCIIDERNSKTFEDFEEIKKRCSFLPNPQKAIANRIIAELKDEVDYKFFVKR